MTHLPLLVVLLITGSACGSNDDLNKIGGEEEYSQAKFNFFDADLLKELGSNLEGNFVVSPASIKTLLGLLMEAAEGQTLSELQAVLRLPNNRPRARQILSALQTTLQRNTDTQVKIDSVAKALISKAVTTNSTYKDTIMQYYMAELSNEDFSKPDVAANNINSWVNTRTRGLIPNLIEPGLIHPDTLAILISAVYFDGKWKSEFQPQDTKDECFYSEPTKCQKVRMMSKNDELYYKYDINFSSHVLQIPYQDERYSMVIVLPQKKNGIRRLTIDANRLSFPGLLEKMNLYEVNLKMPSFTVEYGSDLSHTLTRLGLNDLYSDNADLPYMINKRQGRVSALVHKAKIEVSEKGTKAAAASGASVVPLMFGLNSVNVTLDHPFYYFVYERESQSVLFAGRLSSLNGASAPTPPVLDGSEPLKVSAIKPSGHGGAHNHGYDPSSTPRMYIESSNQYTQYPIQYPDHHSNVNYDSSRFGRK